MKLFQTISDSVSGAVKSVAEKNRKVAAINRLKIMIKNEEDNANEAYIALGKYYYSRLRSQLNNETEPFCEIVDNANRRIEKALTGIEKLSDPEVSWLTEEQELLPKEEPVMPQELPQEEVAPPDQEEEKNDLETDWKEWEQTVHVETAPQSEEPDEVARNFDQGIPW